MLLVTWNVNSLRARMDRLLELLDAHRPDVVCLQETKVDPDAFPHLELQLAGYTAVDHGRGGREGVAVLVRDDHRVDAVERGLPGEPDPDQARWVEVDVTVGDEPLTVVSVYVPNGRAPEHPAFAAKLRFLEAMAERAATLQVRSLVIAGDLNVAPEDRDVFDPAAFRGATHVTDAERSGLRAVTAAGLVDAYRHVHPDDVGFTWWDYRAGAFHRDLGMRIDLVFVSPSLATRALGCEVDRGRRRGHKPSDHAPLLLTLDDTVPGSAYADEHG